jgi:Protein of unknown function with HXXEE motif
MAARGRSPFSRLAENWVYGGTLAAPILLVLLPFLEVSAAGRAVVLALVAYMLHQYEEHDDDRFRRFVNTHLGPARRGLTTVDVLIINVIGVWAVLLATLWLTEAAAPGWAAIAAWLLLVNALAHIGQGLAFRRYNPGLATAVVLFVPLSVILLTTIAEAASLGQHLISAGLILALHAAIVAVARRPARNQSAQ